MRRWVFRILTGLSAVLSLASIFFWIRSYLTADIILGKKTSIVQLDYSQHDSNFISIRGQLDLFLGISHTQLPHEDAAQTLRDIGFGNDGHVRFTGPQAQFYAERQFRASSDIRHLGFGYVRDGGKRENKSWQSWRVLFPWAAPTIIFGLFPTVSILRYLRHRKRFGANFCAICGYDLRASPDRCPECGAQAARDTA